MSDLPALKAIDGGWVEFRGPSDDWRTGTPSYFRASEIIGITIDPRDVHVVRLVVNGFDAIGVRGVDTETVRRFLDVWRPGTGIGLAEEQK